LRYLRQSPRRWSPMPIRDGTARGEIVLDALFGSGTTVIDLH
jgi:hypothetical protein